MLLRRPPDRSLLIMLAGTTSTRRSLPSAAKLMIRGAE
jgi:hypothetical protein